LGQSYPLHVGAGARALLSCLADAAIAEYFARGPLEQFAPTSVIDPERLWQDIHETRHRGYALGFGDLYPETRAFAVPVRGADGEPVASISLVGAVPQFDPQPEDPRMLGWLTLVAELEREVQQDPEKFQNPYAHIAPESMATIATIERSSTQQ
jgi:IclR family KDG regulon transcriptional repressor